MNNKLKIYSNDWLALHPYEQSIPSDLYFTKLANQVVEQLHQTIESATEQDYLFLSDDDKKKLSCIFTAYFEDIISESRIWSAFIEENMETSGKHLPFYSIEEYFEGEVNEVDLQFLAWHFFSQVHPEIPINPLNPLFRSIAQAIFPILDAEFEEAPANEKLFDFIHRDADTSLQEFANIGFWLMTESFLFNFNSLELDKEFKDAEEAAKDYDMQENMAELINAIVTDFTFNQVSEFHQLRGIQWIGKILGKDHPLYQDLTQVGHKKNGYFSLISRGEETTQFKHIATEKTIEVDNLSIKGYPKELMKEGIIIFAGVVKWDSTWSFIGDLRGYEFEEELVTEIKSMDEEQDFFLDGIDPYNKEELLKDIKTNIEELRQENPEDEEIDLYWSLFYDLDVPYAGLKELILDHELPDLIFPEAKGEDLMRDNLDFVLSYYKRY